MANHLNDDDETLGGVIEPADVEFFRRAEAEAEWPVTPGNQFLNSAQIVLSIIGVVVVSGAVIYALKFIGSRWL